MGKITILDRPHTRSLAILLSRLQAGLLWILCLHQDSSFTIRIRFSHPEIEFPAVMVKLRVWLKGQALDNNCSFIYPA